MLVYQKLMKNYRAYKKPYLKKVETNRIPNLILVQDAHSYSYMM